MEPNSICQTKSEFGYAGSGPQTLQEQE